MELTYSATKPEELSPFGKHSVESGREVSSDAAIAAVGPSAAEQPNPADKASASTSVVSYGHASDEQLLAAAKSGDGRAFVELSGRSEASVHKRVFSILRNREDTEDALQDALFKAYTHLDQFRGSCRFSSWLTRIAINSALMQLRKRRSLSEVSFHQRGDDDQTWEIWESPDPSPNAEQVYARRQTVELLSRAVEQLPSCYRSVVNQYHEQDRSVEEAANTLGITVAAAKSRLQRARRTMRSTLEGKRTSLADVGF
jgi:RNA polymerase sigma-70 factor (ECF subfamily)